jgi:hypothetical protein
MTLARGLLIDCLLFVVEVARLPKRWHGTSELLRVPLRGNERVGLRVFYLHLAPPGQWLVVPEEHHVVSIKPPDHAFAFRRAEARRNSCEFRYGEMSVLGVRVF